MEAGMLEQLCHYNPFSGQYDCRMGHEPINSFITAKMAEFTVTLSTLAVPRHVNLKLISVMG